MNVIPLTAETAQTFWDKALSGLAWFFTSLSPAAVWAILGIAVCVAFFVYYWWCLKPRPHSLEWVSMAEEAARPRRMTLTLPHHKLTRRDIARLREKMGEPARKPRFIKTVWGVGYTVE